MEYRTFDENTEDFENVEDARDAMRDYVQDLMERTDPDDMMDTLLIMSNICEARAMLAMHRTREVEWYDYMGKALRFFVERIGKDSNVGRPHQGFEDATIYFPEPTQMH